MKNCLIIFAKEPMKGKVKTRLEGYLSQSQCLNLYKALVKDTIALVNSVGCKNKILAYEIDRGTPKYLKKIALGFKFYRQKGRNLGEKMNNAIKEALKHGVSKVVIIGSDSPTLPAKYIKQAFYRLDKNDIVIGPSHDGGYYLIGLKKACMELFRGIKWGSDNVLINTIKTAKKINKKISLLHKWYDVDEPGSLEQLKKDLKIGKTAKWTKRFLRM